MSIINISEMEQKVAAKWDDILTNSSFIQQIMQGNATKELYAIYMIETYHYTKHHARNQALVGVIG
ncbi:MAG: iron-containing redox enzyme family protein, partial [Algicola sp.]|nr:iron-containing redox enzyme family protein [Algicola sp.]